MEFLEALENSLKELGIENLDDNSDDIPAETDETDETEAPEDEAADDESVDEPSDDEQEDEEANSGPLLDIVENAKLKLPDGSVVSAKEALLRQADYTRKTQELAEQRRIFEAEQGEYLANIGEIEQQFQQISQWYEERASKPSEWIAEIASSSSDPTSTLAKALYDLAQSGILDPQFVESFGIESDQIRERAQKHEMNSELEEIKAWRRQQEMEQSRQTQVQQQIQRYENEWSTIKNSRNLVFESPAQELQVKQHLLQFALESNMTRSLVDAYDLMTVRKPVNPPARLQKSGAENTSKKRASRAVTPKSAGSAKQEKRIVSDRDAVLATLEENGF
jgi:hypothetical protein